MSDDWRLPSKPYDLRERLFQFACVIVRLVEFLHTRGPVAIAFSYQVLKCGTSVGANYEEADDGSSDRDRLAKRKICLREIKEDAVPAPCSPKMRLSHQRSGSCDQGKR